MRPEGFDTIIERSPPNSDSIILEQRYERQGPVSALAMLLIAGCLVAAPQLVLATAAIANTGVRERLAENPIVALQLAIAMLLWIALVTWPVSRIVRRLSRERRIEITHDQVMVTDHYGHRTAHWQAPHADFIGLAHAARTSLTGRRDELVLVHRKPEKSLIVAAGETISADVHLAQAAAFGLPQLPAAAVFAVPGSRLFKGEAALTHVSPTPAAPANTVAA